MCGVGGGGGGGDSGFKLLMDNLFALSASDILSSY